MISRVDISLADPTNQTEEQYDDWYILRRIGSIRSSWNNFPGEMWSGIPSFTARNAGDCLGGSLIREEINRIVLHGIKLPFHMRSADRPVLDGLSETDHGPPRAAVLAPLTT